MNLSTLKTGIGWSSASAVITAFSAIIRISILTRYLEKSDFGIMAICTLVLGFSRIFSESGLSNSIFHKKDISKESLSSIYWTNITFAIIVYIGLFMLSPIISRFYEEPELIHIIQLTAFSIIIASFGRQFRVLEIKSFSYKNISLIDISSSLASLLFSIWLAKNGFGVLSLAYSYIAQVGISSACLIIIAIKKRFIRIHYNWHEVTPYLRIGLYQSGGQLANFICRDLDIILIGKFFSTDDLGGYSLAKDLARKPIGFITPIINKIATPLLASTNSEVTQLKNSYLKTVRAVANITIPLYVTLAISSPLIFGILYDVKYNEYNLIFSILSLTMIPRSISSVVGNLLIATGRTDLDLKWNILYLLSIPIFVTIGLNISIQMVAAMILLHSCLAFLPCWKYIIKPLTSITLREYLTNCVKLPQIRRSTL